MIRKERRSKIDIYYDIIIAIQQETTEGGAKPTKVQYLSNMSYDKLMLHLEELEKKKMINKGDMLSITERGREFLANYEKMREFLERMGL